MANKTQKVEFKGLETQDVSIKLIGITSLICNRFPERAPEQILNKQQKKAKGGKKIRDPEKEYLESLYPKNGATGCYVFPSQAFKNAAVGACRYVDGLAMTVTRGALHIMAEYVDIEGEPSMREDTVRLPNGSADLRYRAEFKEWSVILPIRFNSTALSLEQVASLFDIAGFGVGVGDWRPEKNGSHGMFRLAQEGE